MLRWMSGALLLLSVLPHQVFAQGAVPALNEQQRLGQRLVLQHCTLCHTPQAINTNETIGPLLSRDSAGGKDDALREAISNGTPRMPGFKVQFEPAQIDAVIAYLKTVQPQEAAAPR